MLMVVAMALLAVLMVVVVMLMVVAAALFAVLIVVVVLMVVTAALLALLMVVVVLMVVAMALLTVLMVVVVMLMIVAMALLVVLMVVVMLMVVAMALLAVLMVVVMLMIVTAALLAVLVVVMVVMLCLLCKTGQLGLQRVGALHSLQELSTRQIVPGRGDDDGGGIMLAEEGDGRLQLGRRGGIGVGQDDTARILHLVVEEFAEVLHVHLALTGIHHGGEAVQHGTLGSGIPDGANDVGKLAHTGRLDQDTVGGILGQHLGQSLAEVTHQGATNTAGVHFIDLNTGLGQKSAVDADLAKLVLDQHKLLARIGLGDQLLDQGCLTGAEKAGKNINFRHGYGDSLL